MAEQNQRTWPPDRKKFWQGGIEFWQDGMVGPPLKMTQLRLWPWTERVKRAQRTNKTSKILRQRPEKVDVNCQLSGSGKQLQAAMIVLSLLITAVLHCTSLLQHSTVSALVCCCVTALKAKVFGNAILYKICN